MFYFNAPFFRCSLSKISKPTGKNQQIGKQCFLLHLSFKISLRDTSFHISLNCLAFYICRILVEFSNLHIPTCVRNFFQFMMFTFLENALNLCIFTHTMICSPILKFSQKIWRWLGTLIYLHFVWFVIFLNVMALQFCKYLSNSRILSLVGTSSLRPWQLDSNIKSEKMAILMKDGFL